MIFFVPRNDEKSKNFRAIKYILPVDMENVNKKKKYENIALYSVTLTRTISFYSCDIKCDKFNGISFVRVHKAGIFYSHLKYERW